MVFGNDISFAIPVVALSGIFGGIAPDIDHDNSRPIRIILIGPQSLFQPNLVAV